MKSLLQIGSVWEMASECLACAGQMGCSSAWYLWSASGIVCQTSPEVCRVKVPDMFGSNEVAKRHVLPQCSAIFGNLK